MNQFIIPQRQGDEKHKRHHSGFPPAKTPVEDTKGTVRLRILTIQAATTWFCGRRFPKGDRKALWRGVAAEPQTRKSQLFLTMLLHGLLGMNLTVPCLLRCAGYGERGARRSLALSPPQTALAATANRKRAEDGWIRKAGGRWGFAPTPTRDQSLDPSPLRGGLTQPFLSTTSSYRIR